jgi:hypothetical protein
VVEVDGLGPGGVDGMAGVGDLGAHHVEGGQRARLTVISGADERTRVEVDPEASTGVGHQNKHS